MGKRKVKDEADARACLAAERAAGGDTVKWAREHGVDGRSLNAWRINLARRVKTTPRRGPVRAPLVELVPAPPSTTARYVLDVHGVRVEFDDGCATETLRRVVQALRSC